MAVAPEKIKARLKALFPKANLSTKRLDAYVAKLAPKPADDADDAAIDAIITDYNDVIDFEAVAKEDDKTRTLEAAKAKAEADAKARGKGGNGDGNDDDDDDDDDDTTGMSAFEKTMLKKFGKLESDLETIKAGKTIETKKATASELFGKSEILKKIPETIRKNWENRIDVNSETPFEEQIQALESEYSELVQVNADNNQYGGPAGGGNPSSAVDEKLVEDIVNTM